MAILMLVCFLFLKVSNRLKKSVYISSNEEDGVMLSKKFGKTFNTRVGL